MHSASKQKAGSHPKKKVIVRERPFLIAKPATNVYDYMRQLIQESLPRSQELAY